MKRLHIILLITCIAAMLCSCSYKSIHHGHTCRWELCPYKGVTADLAHKSVIAYTGEAYTDAYFVDMLHLQYPTEEYEQLEERLNTINNK